MTERKLDRALAAFVCEEFGLKFFHPSRSRVKPDVLFKCGVVDKILPTDLERRYLIADRLGCGRRRFLDRCPYFLQCLLNIKRRCSPVAHFTGVASLYVMERKGCAETGGTTMNLECSSIHTTINKLLAIVTMAVLTTVSTAYLRANPAMALAAPQSFVEDFTSDTNPTMPGFASSVFIHSPTGSFSLGPGFPGASGHSLALFAGATDEITFPGHTVNSGSVQIFAFGPGLVIFEGVDDALTARFGPLPATQIREATNITLGDNGLPLGRIVKITLVGSETLFDNVEISTVATSINVNVLVRPGAINPDRNNGLMKAVILSDPDFDATTVDPATVQFGAATIAFRQFFGDEDEDGDTDLIFFFLVGEVGIQCGDTGVTLTGSTTNGQLIEGVGAIRTVGCN